MPTRSRGRILSCYYKALPRIIPELLLLARPGSEVALVSPWIENVTLNPPSFGHSGLQSNRREMRLGELLLYLAEDRGIRLTVIVRERDHRLQNAMRLVARASPKLLEIREVPYLHAKCVATEAFVLETSANLLWTSMFRNVEWCRVVKNDHANTRQLLRA